MSGDDSCDECSPLLESYDRVAADYAEHFRDELAHKPFDRKMLDWLIEKADSAGVLWSEARSFTGPSGGGRRSTSTSSSSRPPT